MEGVELASYRLRGAAYSWFEMWEDSRGEGRPPTRWDEFVYAFMDHFLPAETMESRATEFEVLKQGMSTMDARVRRFVQGLSPLVVNKAATAALHSDMNYGKIVGFAQAIVARKLKIRAKKETSAPPSVHSYQQSSHLRPGSDSRKPHQSGHPGGRSQQQGRASCPKCGSQGTGSGFAQSSGSSAATSSTRLPTPAGRGAIRGGDRGRGGPS
uniref:Uncharacterized protein LOC104242395 n=1 Tax=Nicotiana sylvestris TaxID=4096 RepID=A0A1U7XXU5_NICSY|nr:PREDICTED: uncharacterized protein LOC104242395 [Nicotiana sylvestris]